MFLVYFLFLALSSGGDFSGYNSTYPLSPVVRYKDGTMGFSVAAIADMDLLSPSADNECASWYLRGILNVSESILRAARSSRPVDYSKLLSEGDAAAAGISLRFDSDNVERITSGFAFKKRGAELSDLVAFNGKILTCDDRTGIVFEVVPGRKVRLHPKLLLVDGDGTNNAKGFKCEWMTVKDSKLYVGGLGKEWTTGTGEYVNDNPLFVKVVSADNSVAHVSWKHAYEKIRKALGFEAPGYMVFEAVSYSAVKRRWIFLPRRASVEKYDEREDRLRGSNLLIDTDRDFGDIRKVQIGNHTPSRGFSSFKFVPNTRDNLILALRTEEIDDEHMKSYYTVFSVDGQVLIPETELSDSIKYEGIEFV